MSINIKLPDGSVRSYDDAVTCLEIAESISSGLARVAIACTVNGSVVSMDTVVDSDADFVIHTFRDEVGQDVFRHTASHVLAQAVKRLYPTAKLAIGPSVKNGFYYDIEFDKALVQEDLAKIEAEMSKIVKENLPIVRSNVSKADAIAMFTARGESYKVELIEALEDGHISLYTQGEFTDLCRGPHMASTGKIKAFKLTSLAGAYWRGDVNNKMLTRIYGTAFDKKADLELHLERIEEAKRRDHRKLGRELDLFDILDEGPGFPFLYPNGMVLRNNLEDFWREQHRLNGYLEVKSPIILSKDLWHRSGHWDHYKDNMYTVDIDDNDYAIKPMNCPGGMLVFKRKMHSYRDLPQRIAEIGLVHRHELSGALHGLMRVRCFNQDDAHIFMTPEQINDEVVGVITMIDSFYKVFGFKYNLELSTRPEDSMGTDEQWDMAIGALKSALDKLDKTYEINEGDGAFYGPKIDFHLEDCLGRTWQCGTIQLDFQMPERFDLTYVDQNGGKSRPVMLHRVVFGSIERFMAILTEHYAGAFPTWLAPVQVKVLPIAEAHYSVAKQIQDKLFALGIRSELDGRNEKIGYRIREAQLAKVPYMLVLGSNEIDNGTVSVRHRKDGDLGTMTVDEFVAKIVAEVADKA